jgi:hypothetical protein
VGPELFHSDGRTAVTKLIVAFCNLANASKIPQFVWSWKCEVQRNGTDKHQYVYAPWHEAILYLPRENLYKPADASGNSSNLMFRGPTTSPFSGL